MSFVLTDEQEKTILGLMPFAKSHGKEAMKIAVEALIDEERFRRGQPDATGAIRKSALIDGNVLSKEYDLDTHAHLPSWPIGAVIVDLKTTIRFNQRYGFEIGDQVLKALVKGLYARFPKAKVVRTHVDCFAVLLPPSAETKVDDSSAAGLSDSLSEAIRAVLPDDGEPKMEPQFTVALLALSIAHPSHPQILGPIVWAECETAHVRARTGEASGVQVRAIDLGPVHR